MRKRAKPIGVGSGVINREQMDDDFHDLSRPFDQRSDYAYALTIFQEAAHVAAKDYAGSPAHPKSVDAIDAAVDLARESKDAFVAAMLARQPDWERVRFALQGIAETGSTSNVELDGIKSILVDTFLPI